MRYLQSLVVMKKQELFKNVSRFLHWLFYSFFMLNDLLYHKSLVIVNMTSFFLNNFTG